MATVATLTLASLGPLTTPWIPPASCLRTTTKVSTATYFIGAAFRSLGVDNDCVPNIYGLETATLTTSPLVQITTVTDGPTPVTIATITGYSTFTPAPTGAAQVNFTISGYYYSSIAFYSPGICPSGYTYAATFTGGRPSAPPSESRYLCCPSGYRVYTGATSSRSSSNGVTYTRRWSTHSYPGCVSSATRLSNVWVMETGWPGVKPTSYDLDTASTTRSFRSLYVTASGIAVAWRATDSVVLDYMRSRNISLPAS
jgi:hypothetical protein